MKRILFSIVSICLLLTACANQNTQITGIAKEGKSANERLLGSGVTGLAPEAQGFHFTVTGDMRDQHATYGRVLQSINDIPEVDGPGVFHVSPGDIDGSIQQNRDVIDDKFGASTIW